MKSKKQKKLKLLKGEKFMYVLLVFLIISIPTVNVFSKALLSETNIKAEKLKSKIEKQENANESLEMQINELVSMENIQKIADAYGLSYISDNIVKVDE
ncbi:MAG: cell division protein FtsL [Bacilli bacterium]|nr:cell division protein FtsL [Bacilli bacterium]